MPNSALRKHILELGPQGHSSPTGFKINATQRLLRHLDTMLGNVEQCALKVARGATRAIGVEVTTQSKHTERYR
jgi:hypothetical protein